MNSCRAAYDDKPVFGFNDFQVSTMTRSVCVVEEKSRDLQFVADIRFKRSGECRIALKNRDIDWDAVITFQVR